MSNQATATIVDSAPSVRTPPRFALQAVWTAQRAIYRLSHGRIGLARPEPGNKFGMLRLITVGRHSGKRRVAIVGYFEDGPNLVTVAMNGWAPNDPAWWLNLQANPAATVDTLDGQRSIHARVAVGEERERLWTKIGDYPGWGADLDGLAARRPHQTAVVVMEPRDLAAGVNGLRAGAQDADVPAPRQSAQRAVPKKAVREGRRLRLRYLWLVPGIGLALFSNTQASQLGVGIVPLLTFGILPDVPRLLGLRHPTMRLLHNAMHMPPVALLVLIGAAVTGLSPFVYVGALAWFGHIVVGWGTGDGIRPAEAVPGRETRATHPTQFAVPSEAATSAG